MSVPVTSGTTPYCGFVKLGVHSVPKRNSWTGTIRRNPIVSVVSETTIPSVVRTDSAAAATSSHLMTVS